MSQNEKTKNIRKDKNAGKIKSNRNNGRSMRRIHSIKEATAFSLYDVSKVINYRIFWKSVIGSQLP